jgi:uncharacterized protein YjiS (DUF1127 family)
VPAIYTIRPVLGCRAAALRRAQDSPLKSFGKNRRKRHFLLIISFLSYAFLHCCGATLLLFKHRNIPILQLILDPGQMPDRETQEKTQAKIQEKSKRKRPVMFASIVRFIREWKRYNQSLSELSRLCDRELADIGISRSDIQRVAWNVSHKR